MAQKKKVCLYSPYLPKHFGGGEKYLFDVALALAERYEVFIAISQSENAEFAHSAEGFAVIKQNYERFLHRKLDSLTFIPTPLGTNTFFLQNPSLFITVDLNLSIYFGI